jgi:hypothetical protein
MRNCASENLEISGSMLAHRPGMTADKLPPVRSQRRLARLAQLRAVLLQAGQHHLIAIIEVCAAKARSIAPAGILARPLLRRSAGGDDQNKGNREKKTGHCTKPSYLGMKAF